MTPLRTYLTIVGVTWTVLFGLSTGFEPFEFRPYEILRAPEGRFKPGRRVEMSEFGDLAYRNFVREFRRPHATTFTTDRWGFRNPVDIERPRIVVVGDSFVVGSGVSDHETLPARLSAHLGEPVYNYGSGGHAAAYFVAEQRFVEHPPEVVIYTVAYRGVAPLSLSPPPVKDTTGALGAWRSVGAGIDSTARMLRVENGLKWLFKFGYHETRYALFGHPDLVQVDGDSALVWPITNQLLHLSPERRGAARIFETLDALRRTLAARGTQLVFCPIPETGTIYEDLFSAEDRARIHRPALVDVLLPELARVGIPTIDLRPAFNANRRPYLFLRDDAHWNARAIELAARTVADGLKTSRR